MPSSQSAMQVIVALAACLALAAALPSFQACAPSATQSADSHRIFTSQDFKKLYGKSYETKVEEQLRSYIYKTNVETIKHHNLAGHSWKLGVNECLSCYRHSLDVTRHHCRC